MDSSVSPTHGEQDGTAYNGHFGCTCYQPLFLFNQFGDLERCSLRPGLFIAPHGCVRLEPVVERYRERKVRLYFRGDAAFASPDIYEAWKVRVSSTPWRLKANAFSRSVLLLLTAPLAVRPTHVRRYHTGQLSGWKLRTGKRRVVAKVEWLSRELYPRVGFSHQAVAASHGWWRFIIRRDGGAVSSRKASTPSSGRSVMRQVPQ